MAKKKVAVILAGAVAKGAYEAGALRVLAQHGVEVKRIVAASSGALNGTLYASYVRRGNEREGAEDLVEMWRSSATLWKVFAPKPGAALRAEGVSSLEKVRQLLLSRMGTGAGRHAVSLRVVVSPLQGVDSRRLDELEHRDGDAKVPHRKNRTTHELVCDFTEADFDTSGGRERIANAALASSAFPFAFISVPVEHSGLGPLGACIDGGAANNTPIKWAVGGGLRDDLDGIVVISPTVEHRRERLGSLRGLGLLDHVATMLVNERLYRDLREAEQVNHQLEQLAALKASGALTKTQHQQVLDALGWTKLRRLQIAQIRPAHDLAGNAFAAFLSTTLRTKYIERGDADAKAALKKPEHRWLTES